MCHLNPSFGRYFYLNTVLHLVAMSYERYSAIVKSPLTYDGAITKSKVTVIALIWVIPIPLSIGPFFGFGGRYDYNPDVFFCEQGWLTRSGRSGWITMFFVVVLFVVPCLGIVFVNRSVYKTAKSQINALEVQVGTLGASEEQQQEMARKKKERKAAIDVSIVIAAFVLCFLPSWIAGLCRQFAENIDVPAEAILVTSCIFGANSVCNPIIYSIRKRDFRTAVKKMFRRIRVCGSCNDIDNNVIFMNNARFGPNLGTEAFTSTSAAALATQHQDGRLPPIPEIDEANPNQDIDNNVIGMNNSRFGPNLGTVDFSLTSAAALATQHQDGRLSSLQFQRSTKQILMASRTT